MGAGDTARERIDTHRRDLSAHKLVASLRAFCDFFEYGFGNHVGTVFDVAVAISNVTEVDLVPAIEW